ncbi:MAG TPA: serine/threonine-protein kinase [Thermoanaerobaculia bacterium]|nr:serine/threonine-protein kinase [Thermoanaerobaculia bacterium]
MADKIGKYEISEQIGVGGFGAVFKGRDPFIKRTVAIKTCQLNDEEVKSRFFREAELAGNLHHRNITTIYDFGVENGIPYIVQEFLTGEDLDKKIKKVEPLSIPRKVEILIAIAEGLGYAHRHSIIHRDIKPANIRVLEDGSVKIMDFGIAKSLATSSNLTQTGITLGTSAYLAPEQIRGDPLDGRTDIFALGILAYELFTNRKPFRGEHLSTVLYRILNEAPEPIQASNPEVPASLSAVVSRAIEKSPASRYPSMEALNQDLAGIYRQLTGSSGPFTTTLGRGGLEVVNFRDPSQRETGRLAAPIVTSSKRASRRGLWITAAAVILAAGAGAWYLNQQKAPAKTPPVPAPAVSAAPAFPTPAAFPQPVVGVDAASAKPAPRPAGQAAAAGRSAAPAAPASPKPARKYPVQFSSVPMATFSVDGQEIGPSVPARTLQLPEGPHTARFEAPGLDAGVEKFAVGPRGVDRVNHMFPVGTLSIDAPAWSGANVLIDNKFKGVLVGEKRFRLKAGTYRVTLSREGVNPVTEQVTIPQGGNTSWNPPPPTANAPGGGA